MQKEAKQWIKEKINKLLNECLANKKEYKTNKIVPLPFNSSLEQKDCNLEEINKRTKKTQSSN
ncbi:hypothetical protein EKK58_02400 [Candidatus Dependentiae bacterium]|nr:MAG: hypothetical protein EKK58_02400 [Candidatus Dependentiae bacterium]